MPYFGNDASVLDRRIIRMEFDNQKFEKNIAKSQKSVEDFKKTMNFDDTIRGLERFSEATNHIGFDRIERYLERLADKFTGIGDAGEYMVSRVRSAIEGIAGKVESFAKSLSLDQINVGQSKYDALNKAVMTITADGKYSAEQAYSVFERLMTYTNETSYSFADMVNQISAFTAAGQGLTSSERAMEGIANATAKAGQGVSQATSAMQVFSKAMGAGYLRLDQWNSLNLTAHMITEEFRKTLVETAVEVGTLKQVGDKYVVASNDKLSMTIQNLETTLHAGWANRNVLMKTLEKYYFEEIDNPEADWNTFAGQAAKAAQRALSLADALNAMKEAVSAGWMTSFRLFWGDLADAMFTFTNIANRVIEILDRISEWRNSILKTWAAIGGRTSFIRTILGDYGQDVTTGAIGIVDLLEKAGDFIATGLKNFFKIFVPAHLRQYWDEEGFQESFLSGMLYSITNGVTNFFTAIDNFFNGNVITGTGEAKTRLQVFEEIVDGILGVFAIGYNVISSVVSFIQDVAVQLAPSFDAITMFFSELGLALYGAAEDTNQLKPLQAFFYELTEMAKPLTSGINSLISAFTEMLGILVGATDKSDVLPKVFGFIGNAIKFVSGVIVNYGTPILRFFTAIFESIGNVIQNGISGNGFSGIYDSVKTAVLEWSGAIFDAILQFIPQGVRDRISGIFQVVRSFINPIIDLITEVFSTGDGNLYTKVSNWFKRTIKKVTDFFSVSNIDNIKSRIIEWGKRFASVYEYIKQQIVEKSESIIDWIKDKISSIDVKLVGVGALIVIAASHIGDFVSNLFSIFRKQGNASGSSSSVDLGSFLRVINNVVLIVGAIMILEKLPWDKIENSFAEGSIGQKIIHMFKGLIDLLSEIDWWSVIVRAKSLLMELNIARFIYAISSAKLSIANLIKSISSLIKNGLSVKISKPKDTAGSILKIAEALGIMVVSIIALANMPWDKARNSFYMILGVMTALGVFVAGVKGIFKGLDPKVAISITGIVFAVDAMILAMIPLAFIPWQRLTQGLVFLSLIMTALYFFARGISDLGGIGLSKDSLNGAIGLAGAIAILTAVLLPIGFASWGGLLKIGVTLGAILQILGRFALTMKKYSFDLNKEGLNGAIGLAGAIAILMGVLLPLGFASAKGIAKMLITFGGILAILAGFAVIINKFGSNGLKKDNLDGAVKLALAISLLMGVFTSGLLLTQNVNWERIAAFAGGLSVIIIATAAALLLLSKVDFVSGILGIALLSAAVAAIIGVLGLLTPWLIDQAASGLQQAGGKLVNSGDMIVKFASIMTSVGDDSMDHAIGIINKLKDVMFSAASISGLSGSISNFTTNLFDLGLTVKNFASDLSEAGGAGSAVDLINRLSGTASGLERLSKISLTGFTTTLTGLGGAMDVYAAGATSLAAVPAGSDKKASTAKAIEILEELSQGLIEHGAFQIPTNLPDTQEIGVFGGQLAALAIAMVKFEKAGRDLGDGTDNAIKSIGMLSEIEKKLTLINDIDKLVNFFTGNKDKPNVLTEFAKNIRLLGGALADFAKSTTIADEKTGEAKPLNFDAATKTLQALGKIETDLSEPETLIEWFTGVTSQLNVLAGDIQSMSAALTAFQDSATELEGKEASRQEALDAIKTFVEFFNGTEDKEGLAPKIKELYTASQATDDNTHLVINTITQLSEDMGTVGTNLSTYGTELKKVDFKKEKSNQDAALASMSAFIEVVGTIESKISDMNTAGSRFAAALQFDESGKNVVTVLSETMATVGRDLNTFGTKIGEVDFNAEEGNQAAALQALSNFVDYSTDLALKLPEVKGIIGQISEWINGRQLTIEEMANKMGSVGESLGKFGEGISGKFKGVEDINMAISALNGFASVMRSMAQIEDVARYSGGSAEIMSRALSDFINLFTASEVLVDSKGTKLTVMQSLIGIFRNFVLQLNGVTGINETAMNSFKTFMESMVLFKDLPSTSKDFEAVGKAVDQGIAHGLMHNRSIVTEAAKQVAVLTYNAAMSALDAGSPSRLFMDVGAFIDQGMANGIKMESKKPLAAVTDLCAAVVQKTREDFDIHSPSKVFAGLGEYNTEGLLQGMQEKADSAGTEVQKFAEAYTASILESADKAFNDPKTKAALGALLTDFTSGIREILMENQDQTVAMGDALNSFVGASLNSVAPTVNDIISFINNVITGMEAINRFFEDTDAAGMTGFQKFIQNLDIGFKAGMQYVDDFFHEVDEETGMTRIEQVTAKLNEWTAMMTGDFMDSLVGTMQTLMPIIQPIVESLAGFVSYNVEISGPFGFLKSLIKEVASLATFILMPEVIDSLTRLSETGVDVPALFSSMALFMGSLGAFSLLSAFAPGGSLKGIVEITAGLDVVVLNLVAAFSALGALDQFTDSGFLEVLKRGGEVIGATFGAIVGAFKGASTATEIMMTVDGLAEAAKSAKNIDEEGINKLSLAMIALKDVTANLPDRTLWEVWTGTPIKNFADDIRNNLGPAIESFAGSINTVPDAAKMVATTQWIRDLAEVGKLIAEGNALSNSGDMSNELLVFLAEIGNPESMLGTEWNTNWTALGSDLTGAFMAGFSANADSIATTINNAIDHNPVITPVLDLTNIRAGMSVLNGSSISVDTSTPLVMANGVGMHTGAVSENQNGTDLSGIITHMSKIDDDLIEMASQIRNMQIVLDTGVLAGAVTDKIDKNLGLKSFYARRRN